MTAVHRRLVEARAAWYALLGTADYPERNAALERFRTAGRAYNAWLSRIRHHASTRARRRTR